MFANWLEMTSSTGGTGTLTLSVVSGAPDVQDVWGSSGTRKVAYVVNEYSSAAWEGPPTKSESGIGDIALSTMVLTRTKKVSTWSGTVYDNTNPSAISFGTDTAKVRVLSAPLADIGPELVPFQSITSPSDALGMASHHGVSGTGVYTFTANRELYIPFLWMGCGDVTLAAINVTTQATSSGVKAALYEVGSNGQPGDRLVDINSGSPWPTTTTGIKSTAVSFHLPPGWYYAGLMSGHAPVVRAFDAAVFCTPAGTANSGQNINFFYKAGTYATGLSTGTPTSLSAISNANSPILYLRPRNT